MLERELRDWEVVEGVVPVVAGRVLELKDKDDVEADADAAALADVKEEEALGRRSSGVMVVSRVSQVSSSGLKLRRRSPRPSLGVMVMAAGTWS